MKKIAVLLTFALLVVGLVGCGAGIEPAVSARDFNTRLTNMELSSSARELLEISTGVIHADRGDFADLDGWYTALGLLDREELRLQTFLDGREVEVALRLDDNGRVSRVGYSVNRNTRDLDEILELYFGYMPFDMIGENLRISSFVGTEQVEVEDIDVANEKLVEAIYNNGRAQLIFAWDVESRHGDEARISFSFSLNWMPTGDFLVIQTISFSLR